MIGFSDILGFLGLAVALVALYLVSDAIKKAETESRRLIESQLGDFRKKLEKLAKATMALEERTQAQQKSQEGLTPLLDQRAQEIGELVAEVEDLKRRLSALDKSIPPQYRTHIVTPSQSRQVQ